MKLSTRDLSHIFSALLLIATFSTWLQATRGSDDLESSAKSDNLRVQEGTSAHGPVGIDSKRFENAASKLRPSMFHIYSLPGGDDHAEAEPEGAGFLVSREHRLLATAAHVADRAADSNTLVAFQNGTQARYRIDRIWYHPGLLREFDVGLYAASMNPQDGEISFPTIDVAILHLAEGEPALPKECDLANDEELQRLGRDPIGELGFYREEVEKISSKSRDDTATLGTGRITGSVEYTRFSTGYDNIPSERRQWIRTTPILGPGASGGALFLENGRVIALHSCSSQTDEGVPYCEFVRIDLLRQVLSHHKLLDRDRNGLNREPNRRSDSDDRLERLRRAIRLVSDVERLRSRGRYREACENCNKALQLAPDYGMAYFRRAEVFLNYCVANWKRLAVKDKRRFILLASEDVNKGVTFLRWWHPTPDLFQAYINLYLDLISPGKKEIPRNIAFLDELIEKPNHPLEKVDKARLVICRAQCRIVLGDYDGARRDFDEAVLLAPDEPQVYHNRAFFWERRGRPDLAADDRTHAARLSSTQP